MKSLKRLLHSACLPVAAWCLAAVPSCGTEYVAGPRQETVIIDNQGGTLTLGDARITVPPNALEGEHELIMTEGAEPPTGIPEEYEQASEFYTLEPHGLAFTSPVTIRLPYRAVQYSLDLLRLDDDSDTTWEPVSEVTFSEGEATFQTDHFCHLVICGRKKCKDKDGDGFGIACDAGWDCDDDNADVNPDAPEGPSDTCSNGLDDDCDGLTDSADTGCMMGCVTDVECDDGDLCTLDQCLEGACDYTNAVDGTACDDGLYCSEPDTCMGGQCTPAARDCSHLDGACSTGVCNEAASQCEAQPRADGTSCDDGLWCTINDACESGSCTLRDPRNCDDGDVCTMDVCNEDLDRCEHPLSPNPGAEGPSNTCQNALDDDCDGLTDQDDPDCAICVSDGDCDDGMYCNGEETCDASGVCQPGAIPCPGRACDEVNDTCVGCTADDACPLCQYCSNGACVNQVLGNDIKDDCAQDACHPGTCDGQGACAVEADGTICDDGLWCTINDACQSGSCTLRDPQDCDDGNACTSDACNESFDQCDHILVPDPGAEGPPGTCSNGVDDDCDGLTDTDDPDC